MNTDALRKLLDRVAAGELPAADAFDALKAAPPTADLDFATLDHHREWRCGHPEIVYGPGKSPDQCIAVVGELLSRGSGPVLISRVDDAQSGRSIQIGR